MFKVGDSVACIDGSPPSEENGAKYCLTRPKKGEIYTVRGVHTEPGVDGYGIFLEECINPSIVWSDGSDHEWPFDARRFRRTLLRRAVVLEPATAQHS